MTYAAWTGSGAYPPYVSINGHGGAVAITTRAPCNEDRTCGLAATMVMPRRDAIELLREALARLTDTDGIDVTDTAICRCKQV